jgi:hypothetical protein
MDKHYMTYENLGYIFWWRKERGDACIIIISVRRMKHFFASALGCLMSTVVISFVGKFGHSLLGGPFEVSFYGDVPCMS